MTDASRETALVTVTVLDIRAVQKGLRNLMSVNPGWSASFIPVVHGEVGSV
jgi:hypothetical protein